MSERFRTETDSIGKRDIPSEAYYGVQTLRAVENFRISAGQLHPEMIYSLAYIKRACAITNADCGLLDQHIADAISAACKDIIEGDYTEQFIVDPIQGVTVRNVH